MAFVLLGTAHPRRRAVEAFIQSTYARCHGAELRGFPDTLAAILDDAGTPICAAGVRFGLTECFSEQYLDLPIEIALREATGLPADRDRILEVTTLAGSQRTHPFRLIDEIVAAGRRAGMQWGVFTATDRLRSALKRSGTNLVELLPARRDRIVTADRWGRYYETDPWVCAVADTRRAADRPARPAEAGEVALHG